MGEEDILVLQIEQLLHISEPICTVHKIMTKTLEVEFQPLQEWLESLDSQLEGDLLGLAMIIAEREKREEQHHALLNGVVEMRHSLLNLYSGLVLFIALLYFLTYIQLICGL